MCKLFLIYTVHLTIDKISVCFTSTLQEGCEPDVCKC